MAYVVILLIVLGIPVIAFVTLFSRIRELTARIARLEWELKDALRAQTAIDRTVAHPEPPAPVEKPEMMAERRAPAPPPVPASPPRVEREPASEAPPSRTRQEWEAVIGGKLLNRIGALALILGAGFFLKYAFDNDWISEPVRVLIGFAVGALLLYFGARTHRKGLAVFAQGIQGAGIAILYLAMYASYGYYHLVPHIVAFSGMAVVTATAFLVGWRFNSQPTALLGWLGGYLTPIILATDHTNLEGLSLYLVILACGILALQFVRPGWTLLVPLSVLANGAVFAAGWTTADPSRSDLIFGYLILIVMWCIYATPAISHYRKGLADDNHRRTADILNTLVILACMCVLKYEFGMHVHAGIALGIVAMLTAVAFVYLRRLKADSHFVRMQYGLLTALAAALAIKLGFTSLQWEPIVMSLAALAFVFAGTKKHIDEFWQIGCLLLLPVAALLLLAPGTFEFEPIDEFQLVWHLRTLALLVPAVVTMSIIAMLRPVQGERSTSAQTALHAGWVALVFLFLTTEADDYFRYLLSHSGQIIFSATNLYVRNLVLPAIWVCLAVLVAMLGARKSILPLAFLGGCIGALSALYGVIAMIDYDPVSQFTLFANVRFMIVVILLIGIWLITREFRRIADPLAAAAVDAGRICLALIPVILFSAEAWASFGRQLFEGQSGSSGGQDVVMQIKNQRQLVLSGIWLVYSLILITIGILKRNQPLRLMAIGLFALAILKIFIYDLSFLQTLYRIFSFVGLGLILLAVSYVYQRYKDVIFGITPSKASEPKVAEKT